MAVPEQVRKQTEAVAKMYADNAGQVENPEDTSKVVGETAASTPSEQANSVAENAVSQTPTEQGNENHEDTFAQKYRTLQGMYNAEVPRLKAENKELNNRVLHLEQLLSNLSTAPAPVTTGEQALLSEREIEEYGDSINVMRKAAREEVAAANARVAQLEQAVRQMQATVVPRVEQVVRHQTQATEQQFWSGLTSLVPQWEQINGDAGFQSWLLDIDPLTGVSRQTYLEDAQRSLDAGRVASFFKEWEKMNGNVGAQTPVARASQLEKQVAPGKGRSQGAPTGGEPKTYSTVDIEKFYAEVRKGAYKGRDAERDRIERDIFAAQREGRIVAK